MTLARAHEQLAWPRPDQVLDPVGEGPSVLARLAREKIGQELARRADVLAGGVQVGILTANPESDATGPLIAVVCEFARPVSPTTIHEAHRLAWNFCRSPLLVTVEPHLLRAWTCYEGPVEDRAILPPAEITQARVELGDSGSLAHQAAASLHWINLVSGQFFENYRSRFTTERRADLTLLRNLKAIRGILCDRWKIDPDTVHDLLARVIFIQFLFDRKDPAGNAALNVARLEELHRAEVLSRPYSSLAEILEDHTDTYRFFRWLNGRFNGDLFPGKGATADEREREWQEEMKKTRRALPDLADFVQGSADLSTDILYLWPQYSFDAIPLEFISSIYEEFVQHSPQDAPPDEDEGEGDADPVAAETRRKVDLTGVHYTRSHLVDFLLDAVLPWQSTEYNIRVLDPACGSGIFLVKAFQRLAHRWRLAHPGVSPGVDDLRDLLSRNIFGVDKDKHAARVASFSLYLALCDELDPRDVWQEMRFPQLRGRTILDRDFFLDSVPGIRTDEDARVYDLVVGNAPWGQASVGRTAQKWARKHGWPVIYKNVGPLFLAKAAALCREDGRVAMLQPATALLANRSGTAERLRTKLFTSFTVEEIVNLAAFRAILFPNAASPACSVVLRPVASNGAAVVYICPKPAGTAEDHQRIAIEATDVHMVSVDEAAGDPGIWASLMWGGPRDVELVRRLSRLPSLEKLETADQATSREGIIRGRKTQRPEPFVVGKRILGKQFPDGDLLHLDAETLEINQDPLIHRKDSVDFSAFDTPQLLVKQSWLKKSARFAARIVENADGQPVICSQSYVTVTTKPWLRRYLESACLSYNSVLAVYYLLLSSGRFAFERAEALKEELMRVPMAEPRFGILRGVHSTADVDTRVADLFGLKPAERVLVEDLVQYTLPDYKQSTRKSYRSNVPTSPGRRRTVRSSSGGSDEPNLLAYCEQFIRVLAAVLGSENVRATIFQEPAAERLPLRMVAIHLNWPAREDGVRIDPMGTSGLVETLTRFDRMLSSEKPAAGGVFYRRIARLYHYIEDGGRRIPTIYLIKPDQIRYWTRSAALRDADEVAADTVAWAHAPMLDTAVEAEILRGDR